MVLALLLRLSLGTAPQLLSSVDGAAPTAASKYVRLGQMVTLSARAGEGELRWYRLDPVDDAVDNTQPRFAFKQLRYARVELEACRNARQCPHEVAFAHLARSPVAGTGTTTFVLEVESAAGARQATPGEDARVFGGLGPQVHRVTFRRDDSYVGHLTELFGTPYIFGSSGVGAQHQTDLLIGSDCADLAVYGQRRLGRKVPYVSTWTISDHAPLQAVVEAPGQRVAAKEGDLLLFPRTRHVGVLYEDRPPKGVLGEEDLLLHTCWAKPTVEALSETGCASWPVRILRFPIR